MKTEYELLPELQKQLFDRLTKQEQKRFVDNARSLRHIGLQLQIGPRGGTYFFRCLNSHRKEYI